MKVTRQFDLVLKIGISILTLLTLAMIYLYMQVDKALESTRQEMVEMIINRYEMELQNASRMVIENTRPPLIEHLARNRELRRELQNYLAYFKTPEVEHLFVIYRDEWGRLRYLLDGEKDYENQAMFMQRFEPISDIWEKAYETGRSQMHKHMKNGLLWVSIAIPIHENGKVAAVLGSDLSASIRTDVEQKFTQIKSMMFSVASIIAMMLVFGYFQIYYYFKGRSRSFMDPLTGAYNRKFLYEVIANANFSEYQIIMYDVDHFKRVNDTFGHEIGDHVLKKFSDLIHHTIRTNDTFARIGGEEFSLLLTGSSRDDTLKLAERIRRGVEEMDLSFLSKNLTLTVSIGIAFYQEGATMESMMREADKKLYQAKNEGRNRVSA